MPVTLLPQTMPLQAPHSTEIQRDEPLGFCFVLFFVFLHALMFWQYISKFTVSSLAALYHL